MAAWSWLSAARAVSKSSPVSREGSAANAVSSWGCPRESVSGSRRGSRGRPCAGRLRSGHAGPRQHPAGPVPLSPCRGSTCGPGPPLAAGSAPWTSLQSQCVAGSRRVHTRHWCPCHPITAPLFLGAEPSWSQGFAVSAGGRPAPPPSPGSPCVMVQTDLTCCWNSSAMQMSLKPQARTAPQPSRRLRCRFESPVRTRARGGGLCFILPRSAY
ncbi:hypothetical protein HJG60_012089 [Phyllostomus discolor]|uniref:Uncharacterized protein n=1 Tax=Phyllostomus discolor TaxID=89673 RepID=A0A833ZM99_9CHIR|nr:hypothetical protein HJG60_012089 [Phyllostomus discolor]